jgi:hypothetical protein
MPVKKDGKRFYLLWFVPQRRTRAGASVTTAELECPVDDQSAPRLASGTRKCPASRHCRALRAKIPLRSPRWFVKMKLHCLQRTLNPELGCNTRKLVAETLSAEDKTFNAIEVIVLFERN